MIQDHDGTPGLGCLALLVIVGIATWGALAVLFVLMYKFVGWLEIVL